MTIHSTPLHRLMSDEATKHDFSGLKYTVFGMGSSKTHAKYCKYTMRTQSRVPDTPFHTRGCWMQTM